MARGWRTNSIAVLLLVAVAACGSSSTASDSTTQPPSAAAGVGFTADQLCALVTQADVAAAVGSAVGAGVPSGVNAPSCSWQPGTDPGAGATIAATSTDSVGQIPYGLQNVPGPHVTPITGVGDAAFFASGATGTTAELDLRKGGRAVTITVGSTDPNFTQAQQEAAELAIAKVAVGHM